MTLDFLNGADGQGQEMFYDDEIFITFNGIILAASQSLNLANWMGETNGFIKWDWSKIVGKKYTGSEVGSYYCTGKATNEGTCNIPPTQTNGNIAITLEDALVRRAVIESGTKFDAQLANDFSFGFITTGDNDVDTDCLHSTFQLSVKAGYVVP